MICAQTAQSGNIRPQTLDLLVLGPATGLFWRSRGDGKIKKNDGGIFLFWSGSFCYYRRKKAYQKINCLWPKFFWYPVGRHVPLGLHIPHTSFSHIRTLKLEVLSTDNIMSTETFLTDLKCNLIQV